MRSIVIGIIILIIILIFSSLRGRIVVVKRREEKRRVEKEKAPEKINRCIEILELEPGASEEEVNQAYRDLANVWHPDRFANNPRLQKKAEEKLKEINAAYEYIRSFHRWG
jgi:DnaJ-domain-containing protein 1